MAEDWNDTFYDLFREAVGRYHEGHRNVDGFFTDQEIIFLSSIGAAARGNCLTLWNSMPARENLPPPRYY